MIILTTVLSTLRNTFLKFKEFEANSTNDCDLKIRALRTDNGGEYISIELKEYLKHRGIRHELTVPYIQSKME